MTTHGCSCLSPGPVKPLCLSLPWALWSCTTSCRVPAVLPVLLCALLPLRCLVCVSCTRLSHSSHWASLTEALRCQGCTSQNPLPQFDHIRQQMLETGRSMLSCLNSLSKFSLFSHLHRLSLSRCPPTVFFLTPSCLSLLFFALSLIQALSLSLSSFNWKDMALFSTRLFHTLSPLFYQNSLLVIWPYFLLPPHSHLSLLALPHTEVLGIELLRP